MKVKKQRFKALKNVEIPVKDVLLACIFSEVVWLIGSIGINPTTEKPAFIMSPIYISGFVAILIIFILILLFFADWPIDFEFQQKTLENDISLTMLFKSWKGQTIELSKLEIITGNTSFQINNLQFGKEIIVELKHPEKPLLLSQIKKENLSHAGTIELRLDYKVKGKIKTESQLIVLD